ncbi:MAG: hypothetical protein Kow0031_38430 [Anaerolineae bacterium]
MPEETQLFTPDEQTVSVLLDCLRYDGRPPSRDALARLAETEWQALAALASRQSLGPLLDHRLTRAGLAALMPDAVKDRLRQEYRHNTLRNLKLEAELRQMVTAFRAAGIPVIALKGIYLALAVYKNRGLRSMSDIDLLLPPRQLEAARQALLAIGYSEAQEEIPSTSFQHLPPLRKPDSVASVELHWTILPETGPFQLDVDGLWQRAIPLPVSDFELLALCSEDMLLHLCLHTAYMHRFVQGVRSLVDLAEIIHLAGDSLDWAALEERSRRWQCLNAVQLSLRLARQLLHLPLPTEAVAAVEAVEIPPQLLGYALNQLLGAETERITIARNFADLWSDASPAAKAGIVWRSIFRPKKFIARMYGLPEDSWRVYGYYPVRAWGLWRRYSGSAREMLAGESPLADGIGLDNALVDWLEQRPD